MNFWQQWLVQTNFELVSNSSSIEACRQMCSNVGFFWRLPGRKIGFKKNLGRNFLNFKTCERSELSILRMFDKDFRERDIETGAITSYKDDIKEVRNLFSKAKQLKFGNTRAIMNELVMIDNMCLQNGNRMTSQEIYDQDCITHKEFFVVSDCSMSWVNEIEFHPI